MRKRILWVEDKIETIFDMIAEDKLFNQNLDENDLLEFDKLKNRDIEIKNEFLRKKNIFLKQDFCEACEIIFNDENFDISILDVNFPSPMGDELNSKDILKAKELFVNSCYPTTKKLKKEFETVFDEIIGLDEYSGLLLFFIICLYYEKERNISDVTKRICIFTQYDINFENFIYKINEKISASDRRLTELGITKYIKDIERCFWHKNKDEDKLKHFIEYDEYADVLRKKLGKHIVKRYLKILKEKDDKARIGDNLKEVRIIYEEILNSCLGKIPDMRDNCTDSYGNLKKGKSTIDWLTNNNHINSIHRNFFFSINSICNKHELHGQGETGYQPTLNTINSLFYALQDTILWFNKIS